MTIYLARCLIVLAFANFIFAFEENHGVKSRSSADGNSAAPLLKMFGAWDHQDRIWAPDPKQPFQSIMAAISILHRNRTLDCTPNHKLNLQHTRLQEEIVDVQARNKELETKISKVIAEPVQNSLNKIMSKPFSLSTARDLDDLLYENPATKAAILAASKLGSYFLDRGESGLASGYFEKAIVTAEILNEKGDLPKLLIRWLMAANGNQIDRDMAVNKLKLFAKTNPNAVETIGGKSVRFNELRALEGGAIITHIFSEHLPLAPPKVSSKNVEWHLRSIRLGLLPGSKETQEDLGRCVCWSLSMLENMNEIVDSNEGVLKTLLQTSISQHCASLFYEIYVKHYLRHKYDEKDSYYSTTQFGWLNRLPVAVRNDVVSDLLHRVEGEKEEKTLAKKLLSHIEAEIPDNALEMLEARAENEFLLSDYLDERGRENRKVHQLILKFLNKKEPWKWMIPLAHSQIDRSENAAKLARELKGVYKQFALNALKEMGQDASVVYPEVKMLFDTEHEHGIRVAAAKTLITMKKDNQDVHDYLVSRSDKAEYHEALGSLMISNMDPAKLLKDLKNRYTGLEGEVKDRFDRAFCSLSAKTPVALPEVLKVLATTSENNTRYSAYEAIVTNPNSHILMDDFQNLLETQVFRDENWERMLVALSVLKPKQIRFFDSLVRAMDSGKNAMMRAAENALVICGDSDRVITEILSRCEKTAEMIRPAATAFSELPPARAMGLLAKLESFPNFKEMDRRDKFEFNTIRASIETELKKASAKK